MRADPRPPFTRLLAGCSGSDLFEEREGDGLHEGSCSIATSRS